MGISNIVSVLLLLVLLSLSSNNIKGVEAFHHVYENLQSQSVESVDHLHRTAFHFQPPKHWINGTLISSSIISYIVYLETCVSLIRVYNDRFDA